MSGAAYYYYTEDMKELIRRPNKLLYNIKREKFPDGTPNIFIEGLDDIISTNAYIDVVYYTQYSNLGEKKMEEYIIHVLADTCNVHSLTVVDLFDPLATMERIDAGKEGTVATANVDAHFWKTLPLPDGGHKIRRILFDHHTLHNRFYYSGGNTTIKYLSAMPLMVYKLKQETKVKHAIVFPDEGAYKRFHSYFLEFQTIICGKVRVNDERIVKIMDSDIETDVYSQYTFTIVDDLVRSGGTLIECGKALIRAGALTGKVQVFVTHAQFPQDSWKRFIDCKTISMFYTTNTIPRTAEKLVEYPNTFTVFDVSNIIDINLNAK